MAWLEAVTYLATLTYKFFRGDPEERGERRREEYYNSYGTEWNPQHPYGSQQIDSVYGHEQWSGSEEPRRGMPQEQWYTYRIRDQSGDTEIDVVRRQRVEEKKKGRGLALRRRVDYEESGMITKKYVDQRGKEVIEQQPYSSRMCEDNQYFPEVGDYYEDGVRSNAAAGMHEMVHREHRKRW